MTFLQELHYYPFGMLMEGIGTAQVTNNGYKYNFKELNEDLGLNLHDYGARWYDASLGRWWSVDPMSYIYPTESAYNYAGCNPLSNIDLLGLLKYPSGANYGKYKKLTSFLKGENGNFKKFLSNPDIRDGLKIMGGWTDEEIEKQILRWDDETSLELELTYTPGGDAMINGNTTYSNIQVNQALADKLESATSIEEERGILLAIMTTILHECIHWGDNQNLDVMQQTEGNFSKKGNIFRYKGEIIADKAFDETGNAFESAVWGGGSNVSSKIDDASIQAFIQRWQILYANEKPEEKDKAPEPVPRA